MDSESLAVYNTTPPNDILNANLNTLNFDSSCISTDILDQGNIYEERQPEKFGKNEQEGKPVKHFDGSTTYLRRKKQNNDTLESIRDEISSTGLIDMNDLFKKVRLKTAIQGEKTRKRESKKVGEKLWTEKYCPSRFVDLCSAGNDKQYRLILHWLRKWDPLVFKKRAVEEDGDFKKILLICGPPGIGKTVAAHILAKQSGYSVQEINAANSMDKLPQSDTLSGAQGFANVSAALRLKITNALTTNSLTSNNRPTCLVIDEIDSSANAGDIMRVLYDLVQLDRKKARRTIKPKTFGSKASSKDQKKEFSLNRPIICIANDIYSTSGSRFNKSASLEKLRQISEIISFRKPHLAKSSVNSKPGNSVRSLKEHLMVINDAEKLGMDYQEIGEVIDVCEGDIRACINYMQFNGRRISTDLIEPPKLANKGQNKDKHMTWISMVETLFKRDPRLSKDESFNYIMQLISNGTGQNAVNLSGNLDKVINACFGRYLDFVHFQDDSLYKPNMFNDWLYNYDLFSKNVDIGEYASMTVLKVWTAFSDVHANSIMREQNLIPNHRSIDFETYEALQKNKSIIRSFLDNAPLSTRACLCGGISYSSQIPMYILPYMGMLLTPVGWDSKTPGSIKTHEKIMIKKIADFIQQLGIRLEKSFDAISGRYNLVYLPDFDSINSFENIQVFSSQNNPTSIQRKRQLLFPLIELELEKALVPKADPISLTKTSLQQPAEEIPQSKKRKTKTELVNFFKGKYDGVSQLTKSDTSEKSATGAKIWIKYNEGFSNAVRRNIGWADFWS